MLTNILYTVCAEFDQLESCLFLIIVWECLIQGVFLIPMFLSQIQIYSSSTHQVNKSFTRFKDKVYSGSFRHDGKLLIAGGENGTVQVRKKCLISSVASTIIKLNNYCISHLYCYCCVYSIIMQVSAASPGVDPRAW